MDFEGYKTKIQKTSNLIEYAKCPEDILNNREINLSNDFQYICLCSSINSELVNEVIARLAQNGNREIVEKNVREISMGMWKDLYNKNKAIKEIFIKNFSSIIENNGIITYREIENFVNDQDTRSIMYENMSIIIKKLCTYDRAALIASIKTKENGVHKIRENMELFFQKGEYDISTTYSKILIELGSISEISTVEILETCSKYLEDMLERETAIGNETNDLLSWIYDSMEETQMYNEQRALLQNNIDNAILANFEGIIDKSNYDKETIKILKQFPCTIEKFDGNKNLFIEKSNKLVHMTKIYDLSYEKENKNISENSGVDENIIKLQNDIDCANNDKYECKNLQEDHNGKLAGEEFMENTNDKIGKIYEKNDCNINGNTFNELKTDIDFSECYNLEQNNTVVEFYSSDVNDERNYNDVEIDVSECDNLEQENTVIDIENHFSDNYAQNQNPFKEIKNEIDALQKYAELLEQSGCQNNVKAEDILSAIIRGNLYDTDKIIEKVLKKDNNVSNDIVKNNNNASEFNFNNTHKLEIEEKNNVNSEQDLKNKDVSQNYTTNVDENFVQNNIVTIQTKDINRNMGVNDENALVTQKDNQVGFNKIISLLKRLIRKIKSIFSKFSADRIGD